MSSKPPIYHYSASRNRALPGYKTDQLPSIKLSPNYGSSSLERSVSGKSSAVMPVSDAMRSESNASPGNQVYLSIPKGNIIGRKAKEELNDVSDASISSLNSPIGDSAFVPRLQFEKLR